MGTSGSFSWKVAEACLLEKKRMEEEGRTMNFSEYLFLNRTLYTEVTGHSE
jgi:hypothetical protein